MNGSRIRPAETAKTQAFLTELTELSRKHGVAIGGEPVLFLMDWEDRASAYAIDDESKLSLG
jgi:hypothetical protein